MNNKLQAKDLINIGIFTTIYFVIYFATMMLGYIPILDVLLGLIYPIKNKKTPWIPKIRESRKGKIQDCNQFLYPLG